MTGLVVALGTALWLGILTSISPCPLASNIAAISFVGRSAGSARRVLLAGLAYSIGRAITYVLVGMLVVASILSIPSVSFFLQRRMNQVLGPLLIVMGIGILGWLRLPLPSWAWSKSHPERTPRSGLAGSGLLGILFALSFCPVSAGLYFGALIPLAISSHSRVLLPAVFGVGTSLPVVLFAVLIALGAQWAGRTYGGLVAVERVARPITGVVFLAAGLYYLIEHLLGVDLSALAGGEA